jgi:hypothetical protein
VLIGEVMRGKKERQSEVRGRAVFIVEAATLRRPDAVCPAAIPPKIASAGEVTSIWGIFREDFVFEVFEVTGEVCEASRGQILMS